MVVWAVVLAAGRGERFGGRKQTATICGEQLAHRSARTAAACVDQVVVVLPPGQPWDGPPVVSIVAGGRSRADSVRAGLAAVTPEAGIIVICDAAHPLAAEELFERVIRAVALGAAGAVPCIPCVEVIKHVRAGRVLSTLQPREEFLIAQSPHAFRAEALRRAHRGLPQAVEDSALVEALGEDVVAVPGDPGNIHVVTPEELVMAERLLERREGGGW